MVFELVDLEELGEKALNDFCRSVSESAPSAEFDHALAGLVAKVEFAYGVAARLAHRERTLEGTAAIWAKMVSLCDEIASQLKRWEGNYPKCTSAYDRILDFRNEAEKRRALHA